MTDYHVDEFVGREQDLAQLLSMLFAADAEELQQRSIIVEGPAGRGKTWLLYHIAGQLNAHPDHPIFCLITVAEDFANAPWKRLAARLCLAARERLNGGAWPLDQFDASADELQVETLLQQEALISILDSVGEMAAQAAPARLLILLVDGFEEQPPELMHAFEEQFLEPIFGRPNVRVISSRRVSSQQHGWRTPGLRRQTQIYPLQGFDTPAEQSQQSSRQQIIQRVYRAHPANQHAALLADTLFAQIQHGLYGWSNPRANRLLADAAFSRLGVAIRAADVETCLRALISPPRPLPPPQPPATHFSDEDVLEALRTIIRAHPTIGAESGVARSRIAATLAMNDRELFKLLGYFQSCGIGFFHRSGSFVIHPELVELCALLAVLEATPMEAP